MPTVQDILSVKGTDVASVNPTATVLDATHLMNDLKIGALAVVDQGRLVGMFTERDVLRRVVAVDRSPATTTVSDVMTVEVVQCSPDCDLDEASRIMRDRRIRHLPICNERGQLQGLVSIGDLNAYQVSVREAEIQLLHDYVYGRG